MEWHLGRGRQGRGVGFVCFCGGFRVACVAYRVFARFIAIVFADSLRINPKAAPTPMDLPAHYHPEQQQPLSFQLFGVFDFAFCNAGAGDSPVRRRRGRRGNYLRTF